MPVQFLLNLLIALLWVFLKDEDTFEVPTFVSGFLIGIVIIFLMHRFFGTPFYLKRAFSMLKLLWIFNYELLTSSILIMKQILLPSTKFEPGIFSHETKLKSDWEVTALALLLMLTPGSVVLRISPEGNIFYIHAMDMKKTKPAVLKSIRMYEKIILEVTRP
ncbi:Na+/H+ antiporter subunit E [Domibacillus epiphyticus]|uniref:Na+/H+ antiporter subunit E n=1 Tax=Domibacillus epiphyticus TaxID=1714355 RepID=A0A1V2AB64_9BACI|nr:Na+/H+ antiporter subunit E [Domibacillus epiphyticus]OMP68236.1 Na+/H+ antiporter subunit E [Domibacillus epiphyticus]